MLLNVADEIVELCRQAVKENEDRKAAIASAGGTLSNAQKSKAVLVTYRGVSSINAETVVTRYRDLRLLYNLLSDVEDAYKWSIPVENIRPTLNWSGRWGHHEDSMLLVGAFIYGFGNWEVMAKDPKLGLEGKFFLEEGKKGEESGSRPIPNAIHLVRRGDFLLNLLYEHEEKLRSYETSLRSRGQLKPSASPPPTTAASTSSQVSAAKRRAESEAVASAADTSARKRKRRPTPTFTDSESDEDDWYVNHLVVKKQADVDFTSPSMDEASTKEELRPVKRELVSYSECRVSLLCLIFRFKKQLKLSGGDMPRDDKVAMLKESLAAIGRRIDDVLIEKHAAGEDIDRWRRHLWTYVCV